jgi:hypothetical protein
MDYPMDKDDETLDMSWIEKQERILESDYVKEPVTSISCRVIYINQNDYIETMEKTTMNLTVNLTVNLTANLTANLHIEDTGSLLTQEQLLYHIEMYKKRTPFSKYVLADILVFHVDLEPEHIQDFSSYDEEEIKVYSAKLFKKASPYLPISLSSSLPPFHDINTIYFVYKETPLYKKTYMLESAMKHDDGSIPKPKPKKKTKGVQWSANKKTKRRVDM